MLPAAIRLRSSDEFARAVRRGVRAGSRTVVVHAVRSDDGPHVGFVVAKSVGNAVTRNRVKRRLRHMAAREVSGVPRVPATVVVRALPEAAEEPAVLDQEFPRTWRRAMKKLAHLQTEEETT